jgi:murein L,D-transpeptidase YcbB/YkuD
LEFLLRISLLLASAAALSLAACGNTTTGGSNAEASSQQGDVQVSDRDLEKQVMAALDDAPGHGLTRDLFLKGDLPSDGNQRRQALLKAAKEYASALADGKVDPTKIRDVYTVPRPKVAVDSGIAQALHDGKYRDWVSSLAPQTDEYQALSKAFVALVQRTPDLPDGNIPSGKTIKRGDTDGRIPAIAANLKALGYLPPELKTDNRYTPAVAQAVARFQSDSGQKPDGVIGSSTVEALNASPRDRARTLAIAMERLRWLDRNPPATRIDVNTAASYLDYFRDGQRLDHRKVINGQPGWETPQLGAPIFQLVANPTWTVPKSIVEEEIADKGGGWLARNNFTQKDGQWVQGSGPKNSLGIVKFDMKDDQAIYLHDTPAKAIFSMDERHRSHGCVRVEDAIGFAHMLARADGIDDKFSKAMASGKETFVDLNHDIPVRLMYHTAYLGDDGRIHFAADVYGWDNDVAAALGYARKQQSKAGKQAGDIGP